MFSDLNIKFKYDSDRDDLLNEFYIPVLSESVEYCRMSGFFSSTSLAISAQGINKLIENNGKMKLLCSAKLNEKDYEIIKNSTLNPIDFIENSFINDLQSLEEGLVKNHVEALGWMIANNLLEIKIAIPENHKGIFHSKIGILKDIEGNLISFSGSDNETANGWLYNIEEFKVFKSWDQSENKFVKEDLADFNKYWCGETLRTEVFDLPEAIKKELISLAPSSKEDLNILSNPNSTFKLRYYQEEAINNWFNNECRGIFEMATGTGKTFTALECFKELSDSKDRLLTVIACPLSHLIDQWVKDVEKFHDGPIIIGSGKNPKWKKDLNNLKKAFYFKSIDKAVIMTSHASLSSDFFIKTISNFKTEVLLIVDEVHGIGSSKQRLALTDDYNYRLGLSATPNRWLDEEGTQILMEYFNGVIFEFDIERALNEINPDTGKSYLTPYIYKPIFVDLNDKEYRAYKYYTSKIDEILQEDTSDEESNTYLKKFFNQRQDIIDNAYAKYNAFITILEENPNIDKLIVFCSPKQIDDVQKILNKYKIIPQHRFTQQESSIKTIKNPISQREDLLEKFSNGIYKALVAIKCLDEGVDVPSAENAIIMSSTSNPREHVQRRGRILRRCEGKEKAIIYDILVFPKDNSLYGSKLVKKDIKRYEEFARNAENSWECLKILNKFYTNYLI